MTDQDNTVSMESPGSNLNPLLSFLCFCYIILWYPLTQTIYKPHTQLENIADNEEFEIISNPDLEDLEGKRKPRDVGRTISVTSDELLGVVRVNESPMDDDSLEFHDTADDQQFEVLESTGVVKSDSSEMQPQEENIEAEGVFF